MNLVLLDGDVSQIAARRRRPVRFLGRQLPFHIVPPFQSPRVFRFFAVVVPLRAAAHY